MLTCFLIVYHTRTVRKHKDNKIKAASLWKKERTLRENKSGDLYVNIY